MWDCVNTVEQNDHDSVLIELPSGRVSAIDKGIVSLLRCAWRMGFETYACCEGTGCDVPELDFTHTGYIAFNGGLSAALFCERLGIDAAVDIMELGKDAAVTSHLFGRPESAVRIELINTQPDVSAIRFVPAVLAELTERAEKAT